jgi:trimeric autotransporter adhesin
VASTIQIKRGSGAPGSLADGELAVDTGNKILYVGNSASGVVEISRNTIDGVDISDGSNTVAINAASGTESYTLTLPGNDGDNTQVLTTNGSGVLSWTTPTTGTITKTGTPADGQVSVWTGATELEGDAALTFATASDTLNIGASNDGTLTIGGVTIINNGGSGAVALSGINSLDATTEATIEAAIDTLSNLTSIGTIATGVWQATDIAVAHGGTGASSAGDARTNLGVDPAGTDNSTNVTLAGSLDYLTISGQEITRGAIVLTTDVSGTLPVGNGGTGATTLGDNRVLTGAGTSAISAEANMTFDGSTLAVTGDVNITGDLSVAGNTTITDTTTVSVEDSMLKLASNNTNTDTVDIGFYGVYVDSGTKYAGIIRDASDGTGVFKVWGGFTSEPGVTANFSQGALAQLDAIVDGGTY